MLKFVFLGSKPIGAACMQVLLDYQKKGKLEILAVKTTSRNEFGTYTTVEDLAREHQIQLLESLDDIPECDFIISVQHHEILKQKHIDKAKIKALNLHLAPLPEYRGCNQFSFAIMNEAKEFGVSVHEMDTQVDHGALLFEDRFKIPHDIWVEDLYKMTEQKAYELFELVAAKIILKKWKPKPISIKKRNSKIYFRKDIEKIKRLSLEDDPEMMDRKIRACSMPGFDPPYIVINEKEIPLPQKK